MSPMLSHAIDRLFDRLTAVYGSEFTGRFAGMEPAAVKKAWAHELSSFTHDLESVAWALDHLPEKAPNAIQFRNLCRTAPRVSKQPMLESDAPVRGPNEHELAKLQEMRQRFGSTIRQAVDEEEPQ